MADLTLWSGPSYAPEAKLPGSKLEVLGCYGDRPPHCPSIADGFVDADERRLPGLLAHFGLEEQGLDRLALAAFSAGGSLVKRVLLHPKDRAKVKAVHLADATYTSEWVDAANRVPPAIEGFVRYGVDAAAGQGLIVATASPNPNKTWATGWENLRAMRDELERRTGRHFVDAMADFAEVQPQPERAYKLGETVLFAEFPAALGHGGHVTQIADQIWQKVIKPRLALSGPALPPREPGEQPREEPSDWIVQLLSFAAGTALGWSLLRWLQR